MKMVASTDIKFYVHSNNNAPQLLNAYGSMIGVLDACLVNGMSLGPVSTLTAVGTTVTAVFSNAHNLMQYQILKIAGTNQAEYNGEHRILTVPNATSVTFQLASTPSATTATGAITASLPPLGWEKPFSSANVNGGGKAAYRSKNLLLPSRPFLRVVDELDPAYTATYAKFAKVGLVEGMSDIDTMLGVQAPFDSTSPGKNWDATGSGTSVINGWARWYYARPTNFGNSTADSAAIPAGNRPWLIIGNQDYFYIFNGQGPSDSFRSSYMCGALESIDRAFILVSTLDNKAANQSINTTYNLSLTYTSGASRFAVLLRKFNGGSHTSQILGGAAGVIQTSVMYSGASNYLDAENVFCSDVLCVDSLSTFRGTFPCIKWVYQSRPKNDLEAFIIDGTVMLALNIFSYSNSGQIWLDLGVEA